MSKVVKRELRFSWHISASATREDAHYIREDHTLDTGAVIPYTRLLKNYERSVYVTKKLKRNHKDKKEFEHIDNLIPIRTTQSNMNRAVSLALGQPHMANNRDSIKNSSYVYGYDITSTSLLKLKSLRANNFTQSSYSVASFDIETTLDNDREILVATICYRGRCYTALSTKLYADTSVEEQIKPVIAKHIPKYKDIPIEITLHSNEVSLLTWIFNKANELAPTILAIWNMDFDIPVILKRLEANYIDPIDVICDLSIDRNYRVCRYIEGTRNKVSSSGVFKPLPPSAQWHTLMCTSKFYVVDAMCVYRQLRCPPASEKPSYSLDYTLKSELGTEKLKFDIPQEYREGAAFHLYMTSKLPLEYIVYNIYDCLSMLELETKTNDLSKSLAAYIGITDIDKFNSQVRKVTNSVFLFGLEHKLIIGTSGWKTKISNDREPSENGDSEDDETKYTTLDLKNWIQILPQENLLVQGLKCLKEYPNVTTLLRGLTYDLDATSAYPSCTQVANVSKKTCVSELIDIPGIDEQVFRLHNLSICLGSVNLASYFNVMFNMPTLEELSELIKTS